MTIYYNTYVPDVRSIITGYNSTQKSYAGDGKYKSIINPIYDTNVANAVVSGDFISLDSSDEKEAAIQNLNLNNNVQISVLMSVNCYSETKSKKGSIFGYSEGDNYYAASAQTVSDAHVALSTTSAAIVDSTVSYVVSSKTTSDAHVALSTTSAAIVDSTVSYTASAQTVSDAHGALNSASAVTADSTVSYTASTQTVTDISINTTTITGTQSYADNPVNSILFRLDRDNESIYVRMKSQDNEVVATSRYYPLDSRDVFAVIFEKKPYNKISVYLNGDLLTEKTSSSDIQSFPSGNAMRLFANGRSTDTFEGSIRSFLLYSKKLSTQEIITSAEI